MEQKTAQPSGQLKATCRSREWSILLSDFGVGEVRGGLRTNRGSVSASYCSWIS